MSFLDRRRGIEIHSSSTIHPALNTSLRVSSLLVIVGLICPSMPVLGPSALEMEQTKDALVQVRWTRLLFVCSIPESIRISFRSQGTSLVERSIIGPLSIMNHFALCVGQSAVSVCFAMLPLTLIDRSIRKSATPLTMIFPIDKLSRILHVARRKGDLSFTRPFGFRKLSLVHGSILPRHGSLLILCYILGVASIVLPAIPIPVDPAPFPLTVLKDSLKGISIGIDHAPTPLSASLFKTSFVDIASKRPRHSALAAMRSTSIGGDVARIQHLDATIVQEWGVFQLASISFGGGCLGILRTYRRL
jgi:hypothetical protein